jgi:hypothetical protein
MQEAFRELATRHGRLVGAVGLRVAVNTGEIVAKDETGLIGDPVNVAARRQDKGGDGDVVIGEAARRLVADLVTLEPLGSLALKGRAEAVTAYRVVSLDRPASATTAAFVGRDDELARPRPDIVVSGVGGYDLVNTGFVGRLPVRARGTEPDGPQPRLHRRTRWL